MGTVLELGDVVGEDWREWRYVDGLLYAPAWRRGLHPGEILAIPYLYALRSACDRTERELRAEVAELEKARAAAECAAARYRRLVLDEARLGLMLQRITV
jgi:hypothetical protein